MTDYHDDPSGAADPGATGPDAMTEPDNGNLGDLPYDEAHRAGNERGGVPGEAADSPAAQGSPVGPPD
jgi:hypothetical protein